MNVDIERLREQLKQKIVIVTFTKASGETRVMHCTTRKELLPPNALPKGKVQLSEETEKNVIRAYDVQAHGWRSFRVDSITEVEW